MQGGDTGNGMMGTRTVSDADHRPAVMPHWEHGWVQKELLRVGRNATTGAAQWTGFCEGDRIVQDYLFEYVQEFFGGNGFPQHAALYGWLEVNCGHVKEHESINSMDALLERTLRSVLRARPNMLILMLADHGNGCVVSFRFAFDLLSTLSDENVQHNICSVRRTRYYDKLVTSRAVHPTNELS